MYQSILIGQDSSSESERALELAMWASKVTAAHLTLCHLHRLAMSERNAVLLQERDALLQRRLATCRAAGVSASDRHIQGWTMQALLDECKWHDLVVVGKRGQGARRLGSIPRTLLSRSPVPVLVCGEATVSPERLLVLVDATPAASHALRIAAMLSQERNLGLHVIEIRRRIGQAKSLERAKTYLGTYTNLRASTELLVGSPSKMLPAYVDKHGIQLAFLPPMAVSAIGVSLSSHLAEKTQCAVIVPMGGGALFY